MESPPTSDAPEASFDSSKPFRHVVVCCTSIPPDQRTEIAKRTIDLGGIHKYDLTPDVTHLIVGDYNTPKYRHVAKERPDIKAMDARWIDSVRDLWTQDQDIDFDVLESQWRLHALETCGSDSKSHVVEERQRGRLLCCLTGFEDNDTRVEIQQLVEANGGEYTGDLSKRVTHLIVASPRGKKYTAAKDWGIATVSLEWLHDSVARGMILDEKCYDPLLPKEERGKGARIEKAIRRIALGKRAREKAEAGPENGQRKLRKTASLKLNHQRDNIWGDILINQSAADLSKSKQHSRTVSLTSAPVSATSATLLPRTTTSDSKTTNLTAVQNGAGVFTTCRFHVYGFPRRRIDVVCDHLTSHGGQISQTLAGVASLAHPEPTDRRFLVVPQLSETESHPQAPDGVHIVTEFFIERCIHNKGLFDPKSQVLGQPFPKFPISGFDGLIIHTTGFRNEQLNQVEKAVVQLGAKYSEWLNNQTTILLCPSLEDVRKQKLDLAVRLNIPIVKAEWLWRCISSACLVPVESFLAHPMSLEFQGNKSTESNGSRLQAATPSRLVCNHSTLESQAVSRQVEILQTAIKEQMTTAVIADDSAIAGLGNNESYCEAIPTHSGTNIGDGATHAPLNEVSTNLPGKASFLPTNDCREPHQQLSRCPTGATVADSEATQDSDNGTRRTVAVCSLEKPEMGNEQKFHPRRPAVQESLQKQLVSLLETGLDRRTAVPFQDNEGLQGQPALRTQRRNREILGRAASNVSAASSASGDSPMLNAASKPVHLSRPTLGLLDNVLDASRDQRDQVDEEENRPPTTQLEYDNPEARKHRAAVLERMTRGKNALGVVSEPTGGSALEPTDHGNIDPIVTAAASRPRRSSRR